MLKTNLKRSAKLLPLGFEPWKSKSNKARSRNKRRNVGSRLPRRRVGRKSPSSPHSGSRCRKPRRRRDSSSCNWRILEMMTLRTRTALKKRLQQAVRSCLKTSVTSLPSLLRLTFRTRPSQLGAQTPLFLKISRLSSLLHRLQRHLALAQIQRTPSLER